MPEVRSRIWVGDQALPLIGRENEIAQLHAAFLRRFHVVISGPAGIGKSTLLGLLRIRLPILICENSSDIDQAQKELARQLDLPSGTALGELGQSNIVSAVRVRDWPIVFDSVEQPSLQVLDLIQKLVAWVPIGYVMRSDPAQGLGRIGQHLAEFIHLPVSPLKMRDMRMIVTDAVGKGSIPPVILNHLGVFYHLARGNPRLIYAAVTEISNSSLQTEEALKNCFAALRAKLLSVDVNSNL